MISIFESLKYNLSCRKWSDKAMKDFFLSDCVSIAIVRPRNCSADDRNALITLIGTDTKWVNAKRS